MVVFLDLGNHLFNMLNTSDALLYEQMLLIYCILRLCSTKNEINREYLSEICILSKTLIFLNNLLQDKFENLCSSLFLLIKECCSFLRVLTLDDDVRVEFGRGNQIARLISKDALCLQTLIGLAKGLYLFLYNFENIVKNFVFISFFKYFKQLLLYW